MTILAARRVLPPDLMVPAEESAPRMKLTGPDAVPPPLSSSTEERMRDRLTPAPEPPLKMTPSSRYQFRIESIESSTERMKQAEACWGTPLTPMLNHTGLLNAAFWVTSRCLSSSLKVSASASSTKEPPSTPQRVIVSATRSITCLSDLSRPRVPSVPRKYFWATMFVALSDQVVGNSTFFCSNATVPSRKFVMRASRFSHSTCWYGWRPSIVKWRRRPMPACSGARAMEFLQVESVDGDRDAERRCRTGEPGGWARLLGRSPPRTQRLVGSPTFQPQDLGGLHHWNYTSVNRSPGLRPCRPPQGCVVPGQPGAPPDAEARGHPGGWTLVTLRGRRPGSTTRTGPRVFTLE